MDLEIFNVTVWSNLFLDAVNYERVLLELKCSTAQLYIMFYLYNAVA